MAEQKEIFHVLDDGNGDGLAIDKVAGGATGLASKNAIPAIVSKDENGDAAYLDVASEGQAIAGRLGQATFAAKDLSDQFAYLKVDEAGALVITGDSAGTKVGASSEGTVTTPGSLEDAVTLVISLNKNYDNIEIMASSFKDCTWFLVYGDDVGGAGEAFTPIDSFRTGAGQYSFKVMLDNYRLNTSGGTGVQQLVLRVNQRSGTGSNFSGSIRAIETP